MTVFKAFLKVLNKCKMPIITYTIILIAFAGFNMQTSDSSTNFVATKPDVFIMNEDSENVITTNLINYVKKNCNIKNIANDDEAINDALFYREVNYIVYIPKNYGEDFLNGKNPKIQIKSTGDYQASFTEMMLSRYIKVANTYQSDVKDENELVDKINSTLEKEADIEITSKLDTNNLEKASFYYNFANYSILAGCVYVICLVLSSFRDEKIRKRTTISSMNYKKYNRKLLLSNSLFAIVMWLFYVILSFVFVGDIMFSMHGVIYIVNSFVFAICTLAISFLIANLIDNKNAINGIVNVVALGSSFLCGAFVPAEWLPDSVLKIAHILPSYYYINSNELLKKVEIFNMESIKPIALNIGIIIVFTIIFVTISNFVAKKKQTQ